MNSDTAELSSPSGSRPTATIPSATVGLRERLLADAAQARAAAIRDSWRALWRSRLLVLLAGVGTILLFGYGPKRGAFDPPGVTHGFGWLGNLLAASVARWDSAWYLVIAHYGYRPDLGSFTASRDAFFPLYPLGIRSLSWLGLAPIVAGVLLSLCALALALYWLHRLTELELRGWRGRGGADGTSAARLAVLLVAFAPMGFFLSAVYSESLYLMLSVGLFWFARQGRWLQVGLLGALASATRSTGLVLILPALLIYLYGPREDRAPDRPAVMRGRRPAYRLRADVLWLALLLLGTIVFAAALALSGGDALAPFRSQQVWGRHFAGPYVGVWDGLKAAFEGARQLLSAQSQHVYFGAAHGSPSVAAGHNLMLIAFLAVALVALVATFRRLPLAYGVYVLAALALSLSYPVSAEPLMSLPRFLLVLFPLAIAAGAWLAEHPRLERPLLCASSLLMVVFLAQFATWHWVA
ncbi:MAG TPA: mannosyltransferase family protein [Solirubrobacteraceae bacterium]